MPRLLSTLAWHRIDDQQNVRTMLCAMSFKKSCTKEMADGIHLC